MYMLVVNKTSGLGSTSSPLFSHCSMGSDLQNANTKNYVEPPNTKFVTQFKTLTKTALVCVLRFCRLLAYAFLRF